MHTPRLRVTRLMVLYDVRMRYIVTGTDQETGHPIELTVEAADVPTAAAMGAKKGVTVAGVRAVGPTAPPPMPHTQAPSMVPTRTAAVLPPPKKKGVRIWLSLVLIVAAFLFPAYPGVPLWAGIIVLGLVVLYLLPPLRRAVGGILRVSLDRPVWRVFKLTAFVVIGASLIGLSVAGRGVVRDRQAAEAKRQADAAAKAQADAEASAKVAGLVDDAKKSLDAGDVTKAELLLDEALNVSAPNRGLAQSLRTKIRNSADAGWVLTMLVSTSDEELARFRDGGTPPKGLDLGHAVLTDRAVVLALQQIATVAGKRAEEKRKAEAAAEVARKAVEEEAAATRKAAGEKAAAKATAEAAERARFEKAQGETIHIGYTSYCAWDSHWTQRLSTNQFLDKRANANWLFVNLTVRNNDKKARMVPPIKLIDEQGREYQSSAEGTMIENSIGVLETLNPDVSKQGYVVFDVPKGRTYKLKLSGGYFSSDIGYIRLKPTEK